MAGTHSFYLVMYNGTGGAGATANNNFGFGWNLTGQFSSGTLGTGASTTTNLIAAQVANYITMPTDNGTGNVFTSQPVNSFSNSLTIATNSALDVTSSGATNIFTGGLTIGNNTLSIIGGSAAPGSVQINGASSLTGAGNS